VNAEWIMYLLGALLALAWKWQRYCYEAKGRSIPFWQASREWFELETFESKTSWLITVAVVWVIGAVYIDRLDFEWIATLAILPEHVSVAFLLGIVAEMIAPAIGKRIINKISKEDKSCGHRE